MKYLFFLGSHPELSIAEIKALFAYNRIDVSFLSVSREILAVNTDDSIDCQKIIDKLGGTIKISKLLAEKDLYDSRLFVSLLAKKSHDVKNFALSFYNTSINKFKILRLLKDVKKNYKKPGLKFNFTVPKEGAALSSAQTAKKILPLGVEFCVVKNIDKFLVAQVVCVQDIDKYSLVDYGIPRSDPQKGMLPPKLAQMMINLGLPECASHEQSRMVIYDPFCGNGRIVLQSLLNGFLVYGSDIDAKSVRDSWDNASWLIGKFNLKTDFNKENIFVHDAQTANVLPERSIDAIITEPHLGKAYKSMPSREEIDIEFSKLSDLYLDSFSQFKPILKTRSKIVCVFPKIGQLSLLEKIIDKILSLGYYKISNFEYFRPYQIVKREIAVFVLK